MNRCPDCGARMFYDYAARLDWCSSTRCDYAEERGQRVEWETDAETELAEWRKTASVPSARRMAEMNPEPKAAITPTRPGRHPGLWRGWRDRQPKRNPVTVKRMGE